MRAGRRITVRASWFLMALSLGSMRWSASRRATGPGGFCPHSGVRLTCFFWGGSTPRNGSTY